MSLYGVYASSSAQIRHDFRSSSALADSLAQSYDELSRPLSHTTSNFDHQRDRLRDSLTAVDPDLFRRFGQVGASVSAIIDVVFPSSTLKLMILPSCPSRCSFSQTFPYSISDVTFPRLVFPPDMRIGGATQNSVHLDEYVSEFIAKVAEDWAHLFDFPDHKTCRGCRSVLTGASAALLDCPPLLFFEVPAQAGLSVSSVLPSPHIDVPSLHCQVSYRLSAVIYLGGYHFTCRLIMHDHTTWKYDGQIDDGRPCTDVHTSSFTLFLPEMSFLGTRKAHFYIYARVDE